VRSRFSCSRHSLDTTDLIGSPPSSPSSANPTAALFWRTLSDTLPLGNSPCVQVTIAIAVLAVLPVGPAREGVQHGFISGRRQLVHRADVRGAPLVGGAIQVASGVDSYAGDGIGPARSDLEATYNSLPGVKPQRLLERANASAIAAPAIPPANSSLR
jgi:hypothetical protein